MIHAAWISKTYTESIGQGSQSDELAKLVHDIKMKTLAKNAGTAYSVFSANVVTRFGTIGNCDSRRHKLHRIQELILNQYGA